MNAAVSQRTETVAADASAAPLLRTLVLCDLVDSTALVERLGDKPGAEVIRKHDRLARSLLHRHGGREIDKTDGFLFMFERPVRAVAYALDYQRSLKEFNAAEKLTLAARVGIHVGDVVMWGNADPDIAKGAKPVEVEGLVKPVASRLMTLALPGQILLSGIAYSLAHRAQGELGGKLDTVRWRTHGRYKFKGVPDPIPVFEVGEEGIAPLKAPPWSSKAHREVPFWRRPASLAVELAALALLIALPLGYLARTPPAIAFASRDWVVVGDLKNLTGNPVFDAAVDTALRLGLEQSRYVNVLPERRVQETLANMQRDPGKTAVDRGVGAEVAIRDGARAVILPTVAEVGGRLRVTAEVIDPHTQTTVWSESADGVGADSVLPSLDRVTRRLRGRLGEALATVSGESQPLEQVATASIDALRAYSLGVRAYAEHHLADAQSLFAQALKIDPQFALAETGIARVLYVSGDSAGAMLRIRRAQALRGRLAPRDALYLDAWSASFGPPGPALEKWKLLASMYPDYFAGANNYAIVAWQEANRYADAIPFARAAAVEQDPLRGSASYLLGTLLLGNGQYPEALRSFAAAEALGSAAQHEYYAYAYAAQRQFEHAQATLARGKPSGVPGDDLGSRLHRIAFPLDQGDWASALREADAAITAADAIGVPSGRQYRTIALTLHAESASRTAFRTELAEFLDSERDLLAAAQGPDRADGVLRVLVAGYLAARAGAADQAQQALAIAGPGVRDGGYPIQQGLLAATRAELARIGGKPGDAIALLEKQVDGSELCLVHGSLLDAYAAAGRRDAAAREATWLADHRGRAYVEYDSQQVLQAWNVMQSDLALLRAAELSGAGGDAATARRQLAAFTRIWPAAGLPAPLAARVNGLQRALASAG